MLKKVENIINAIKERVWSFKGSVLHAKKSGKYYQRYKRTTEIL